MNRLFSNSHAAAAAVALVLTVGQLVGVDALAQHRTVSPHAQVVQLERVVVTAHRSAAAPADTQLAAACTATAARSC